LEFLIDLGMFQAGRHAEVFSPGQTIEIA